MSSTGRSRPDQDVEPDQDRLIVVTEGLLRANQLIVGDLSLQTVLSRIVIAVRELIGASYAALGVLTPDGRLDEFIQVGMADVDVERIGQLPKGQGLLGVLIDDPRPIRVDDLPGDPRSSGFPPGHPPMRSFLGVPIRIRDEVFGSLYLAESTRGRFSAEDEELVEAFAATAATAIDNARLAAAAAHRGEWLQASASIARQMLTADPQDAFRMILEELREISDADTVTIVVPGEDPSRLRIALALGVCADQLTGFDLPLATAQVGPVFRTGEPLLIGPRPQIGPLPLVVPGSASIGTALAVPLLASTGVRGVLTAGRLIGRPGFTSAELDLACGFAVQAALALELSETRLEQQRALMADEHERIAADLHDHVIQRLFAAGLSLQGVAAGLGPGRQADRIAETIGDLDDTIRQIRTTIFRLQVPGDRRSPGLRVRLLEVVSEVTAALGFEPVVRFAGVLESAVPPDLAEDLLAALREALSNVARHAGATSAEVEVGTGPEGVTLEVRDNGAGPPPADGRRSGLLNLERRAQQHGGRFSVEPAAPTGTRLSWSVPVRPVT